jgi:hypothetical protein
MGLCLPGVACHVFPDACIAISGLVERLNTHFGLFESLRRVVADGDRFPEEDVDRHVAKLFLLGKGKSGFKIMDIELRHMWGLWAKNGVFLKAIF